MSEILNARIKSTTIGVEDHGILSFFLHLEGKSWGQGFGGYGHDDHVGRDLPRKGHALFAEHVRGILDCLGVRTWEKLPGTICRIKRGPEWNAPLEAIGHVIEDRWFSLKDGRSGPGWSDV